MVWKRILAGVDETSAGLAAATAAARLAAALGAECIPVHAVREFWLQFAEEDLVQGTAELQEAVVRAARERMHGLLADHVPEHVQRRLVVRPGRAAIVLRDVATELGADALVLGGKHHSDIGRWIGGSTAHNAVHSIGLPVLIVVPTPGDYAYRRILAALDLSEAAVPTGTMARQIATALDAKLRGLCVIEAPVPLPALMPLATQPEYEREADRVLRRRVWPVLGSGAETLTREGTVAETIEREVREWGADLIVVGSHGKGWAERLILGSVTERLLRNLPCSLLVVPVKNVKVQRLAPEVHKVRGKRPARHAV
ncbi:MAG TPA: universal stress protein [Gemmatimonadales bacterium]|jgi:nucleotide-binding universal stress UspA family protein